MISIYALHLCDNEVVAWKKKINPINQTKTTQ